MNASTKRNSVNWKRLQIGSDLDAVTLNVIEKEKKR
jgi:hypothetical protein